MDISISILISYIKHNFSAKLYMNWGKGRDRNYFWVLTHLPPPRLIYIIVLFLLTIFFAYIKYEIYNKALVNDNV